MKSQTFVGGSREGFGAGGKGGGESWGTGRGDRILGFLTTLCAKRSIGTGVNGIIP